MIRKFKGTKHRLVKGFTLVEVLIACAIMTTLLLFIFQGMSHHDKANRNRLLLQTWFRLETTLTLFLQNKSSCSSSLYGLDFDGNSDLALQGIKYFRYSPSTGQLIPGEVLIEKGKSFDHLLYVQDVILRRPPSGSGVVSGAYISFFTFLHITVLKQAPSSPLTSPVDPSLISHQVDLPVTIEVRNANKKIVHCSGRPVTMVPVAPSIPGTPGTPGTPGR